MKKIQNYSLIALTVIFFLFFFWNTGLIINKSKLTSEKIVDVNSFLFLYQNFFYYLILGLSVKVVFNITDKYKKIGLFLIVLIASVLDQSTNYAAFVFAKIDTDEFMQNIKTILIIKYGLLLVLTIYSLLVVLVKKRKKFVFSFVSSFIFLVATITFYGLLGSGFMQFTIKEEISAIDSKIYNFGLDCKGYECVEKKDVKILGFNIKNGEGFGIKKEVVFSLNPKDKEIRMLYADPDLNKFVIKKIDRGISIELFQSWIAILSSFVGIVWGLGLYGLYQLHKRREFKNLIKGNIKA